MESTGVMWTMVSLLVCSSLTSALNAPLKVSCKNEKNTDVDWYILYKAPNSYKYIYIDSGTLKAKAEADKVRPINNIRDPRGVLANTLSPMLRSVRNMPGSFGFLSYSDQPPGSSSKSQFGHSKGVVLGDSSDKSALWLTHSTPQFPFRRDLKFFYPDSGESKGQTFMCVSLHYDDLKTVGEHLHRIRALTFDSDLPNNFPEKLKKAANWLPDDEPLDKLGELVPLRNPALNIMAKKNAPKPPKDTAAIAKDGDLYVQLTQGFNSNVIAQTYGCQDGADDSYCKKNQFEVINVETINIPELGEWKRSIDHSKWAATTDNIWTCISDMNRSSSQYQRRGGALCIKDQAVNTLFRGFVSTSKVCSRKRPRQKRMTSECEDPENDSLTV